MDLVLGQTVRVRLVQGLQASEVLENCDCMRSWWIVEQMFDVEDYAGFSGDEAHTIS